MDHEQLKELLPLEAMGRLEGEEARAMTAHLAEGCDECEAELREFRETLAAMAVSQADQTIDDRIWRRLERRLAETARVGGPLDDRPPGRAAARARRSGVAPGWRVATGIAAAATIALAILAGLYGSELADSRTASAAQIASLEARVNDLNRQLSDRDHELVSLRDQIAAAGRITRAVLAPDLRTIKLGPLPPAPDAAGLVAMSPSRGEAVVQIAGLPPAPAGKTYELWWIGSKSGPIRAAIFTPGPHGAATLTPSMPPAGEALLASAITLEPAGGVSKPTGAMYLKGSW